ncbi:hypothetical protein MBLNU230_g1137t1 [Neophaeotheca triangularis]
MGCCQSRDRSASNNEPQAAPARPVGSQPLAPDSSQAAINRPSASEPNPVQRSSAASNASQPFNAPQTSARPNTRIRAPSPIAKSPKNTPHPRPWSRSVLEREREAFFDTRVTGSPEVWNALRLVSELLREGKTEEAQGILDASGISCPNGRVAGGKGRDKVRGGVYDERGVLYEVPAWVVGDPGDLVEDGEEDDGDEGEKDAVVGVEGAEEGKGKEKVADVGELLVVRARLSHTGADMTVRVGSKQKVAFLVRQIMQQIEGRRVRLAYLGKVLDEGKGLEEQGWCKGHVVNALVFEGTEEMLKRSSSQSAG